MNEWKKKFFFSISGKVPALDTWQQRYSSCSSCYPWEITRSPSLALSLLWLWWEHPAQSVQWLVWLWPGITAILFTTSVSLLNVFIPPIVLWNRNTLHLVLRNMSWLNGLYSTELIPWTDLHHLINLSHISCQDFFTTWCNCWTPLF